MASESKEIRCKGRQDGRQCDKLIARKKGQWIWLLDPDGRKAFQVQARRLSLVCEYCGYENRLHSRSG